MLIMCLRAFFIGSFQQPLKKPSSDFVNKKSQLGLTNLVVGFQLSGLFELSKQKRKVCFFVRCINCDSIKRINARKLAVRFLTKKLS